jgi:hypothetical protein
VVDALRAIGRVGAETAAELERRLDPFVRDAHEGMAEAVHAAVAAVARALAATDGRLRLRPGRVDLRGDAADQPVREAGGAARVVRPREIVDEALECDAVPLRVLATDRVHQAVTAREEEFGVGPGEVRDALHDGTRVFRGRDEPVHRVEVAVVRARPCAGRELRADVGRRIAGAVATREQDRARGEHDAGHGGEDEQQALRRHVAAQRSGARAILPTCPPRAYARPRRPSPLRSTR